MNHLLAKTKGRNGNFFKVISNRQIFDMPDDLNNAVEYNSDYKLEEECIYFAVLLAIHDEKSNRRVKLCTRPCPGITSITPHISWPDGLGIAAGKNSPLVPALPTL